MSSPFSSFQEFSDAKGPIYTFADNPTMIGFLLLVGLAITVYFFYASYTMKQETAIKPPTAIGLLLVAGAASVFGLFTPQKLTPHQPPGSRQSPSQISTKPGQKFWQPLLLLGMVGIGGAKGGGKRRMRKSLRRIR